MGRGSVMITPFVPRPSRFPHFLSFPVSGNATRHPMNGQYVRWLLLEIRHNPLFLNQFLARGGRHLNCHCCRGLFSLSDTALNLSLPGGAREEDGMDPGNPLDMAKL